MAGQGPILDANTLFLWDMAGDPQGNQHTPIVDQGSGGNFDLTVNTFDDNAPWIVGGEVAGEYARATNGIRKFLYQGNSASRTTTFIGDWTIEIRMRLDVAPASGQVMQIFELRGFGESEAENNLMRIGILDDRSLDTFWEFGSGSNVTTLFPSTILPLGSWFTLQLRGVVSGGSRTIHMYINGTKTEDQTSTTASGGTNTHFSLFGRVLGAGSGSADRILRGAISSFHIAAADLGESTVQSRATLRKFTEVASTWGLHTFPEVPSQPDEAGRYPGMNPGPFTDLSGKRQPDRATQLVCDDGFSKSFIDGNTFLMLPNTLELRNALKGEFTLEFWLKHHVDNASDIGLFEWFDTGETEETNTLLRLDLARSGSTWVPNVFYERDAGVNEDHAGAVAMLNEVEGDAKSNEFTHHIAFVFRDNAGTREVDCYLDGAFTETIVCGSMPTGGEDSEHGRFGNSGTNTAADSWIDWVRMSDIARSASEILESYNRGKLACGGIVDTVRPVVTYVDPTPGTPIQPDRPITVDVTDDTGLFCNVALRVLYENARPARPEEVIYTGQRFSAFYSESTVAPITDGFRFVLKRQHPDPLRRADEPGWLATPTFEADPVDFGGNRSL